MTSADAGVHSGKWKFIFKIPAKSVSKWNARRFSSFDIFLHGISGQYLHISSRKRFCTARILFAQQLTDYFFHFIPQNFIFSFLEADVPSVPSASTFPFQSSSKLKINGLFEDATAVLGNLHGADARKWTSL